MNTIRRCSVSAIEYCALAVTAVLLATTGALLGAIGPASTAEVPSASAQGGAGANTPAAPKVDDAHAPPKVPASPLDRFKAMAGDWNADLDADGQTDTVVNYRVIANKSAVVETMFPGTDHEMITVYTMNGKDLVLTHYCALGNQPHLKATAITPERISFEFVSGGNMASRDDMHMDAVVFDFVGPDKVISKWNGFEKGKSEDHAAFVMTRAPKPAG